MVTLTPHLLSLYLPSWQGWGGAVSESSSYLNPDARKPGNYQLPNFPTTKYGYSSYTFRDGETNHGLGLDPVDPLWAGPGTKLCWLHGSYILQCHDNGRYQCQFRPWTHQFLNYLCISFSPVYNYLNKWPWVFWGKTRGLIIVYLLWCHQVLPPGDPASLSSNYLYAGWGVENGSEIVLLLRVLPLASLHLWFLLFYLFIYFF